MSHPEKPPAPALEGEHRPRYAETVTLPLRCAEAVRWMDLPRLDERDLHDLACLADQLGKRHRVNAACILDKIAARLRAAAPTPLLPGTHGDTLDARTLARAEGWRDAIEEACKTLCSWCRRGNVPGPDDWHRGEDDDFGICHARHVRMLGAAK